MSSSEGLPAGWVKKQSKSHPDRSYYFNTATGETTWDKPTAPAGGAGGGAAQVHVLHLLKKHRGSRRPSSWRQETITCSKEEAEAALGALRDRIVAAGQAGGAEALRREFESLAQVESDCSSAAKGGSLGFFGRGQMQRPFEEASFALNVGELSGFVSTDSGVHIILRVA